MLLRLAYLGITNAFALLRLLPGGDRDRDAEILALRHQLAVLQRQLDGQRIRFEPADRAWLAALLHHLPKPTLDSLRLLVRPDTILRWHRDLQARRHAAGSRPRRRGRPRTIRSIRALVLRLVQENPSWAIPLGQGRRLHGLGDPAHRRDRSRPEPGRHHLGTVPTLASRRAGGGGLHRDHHADRYQVVHPRHHRGMNAVMERWVRTCRRELLDRTLIFNQRHLLHALREFEIFYNGHRPHQGIANARPLTPLPEPITDPDRIAHLNIHRRDHLGGILHEHEHAA
jgi:hypothetical protein